MESSSPKAQQQQQTSKKNADHGHQDLRRKKKKKRSVVSLRELSDEDKHKVANLIHQVRNIRRKIKTDDYAALTIISEGYICHACHCSVRMCFAFAVSSLRFWESMPFVSGYIMDCLSCYAFHSKFGWCGYRFCMLLER